MIRLKNCPALQNPKPRIGAWYEIEITDTCGFTNWNYDRAGMPFAPGFRFAAECITTNPRNANFFRLVETSRISGQEVGFAEGPIYASFEKIKSSWPVAKVVRELSKEEAGTYNWFRGRLQ